MTQKTAPRILLIRLSAIGDVIHALHALAALREAHPKAFLGFLVEDRASTLLAGHPDIDRLHVFPRRTWSGQWLVDPASFSSGIGSFLSDLRAARYDVAVDLQGNLKGGVLSALSGAPRRIGLSRKNGKEMNHLFQTESVEIPGGPFHRVDRALRLLSPLGVGDRTGQPRVPVHADDESVISQFLAGADLEPGLFAVIHPTTSEFGRHKRWSIEGFGSLAALLLERRGLRSVVTWGPGERAMAEGVASASAGAAVVGPETGSLTAVAGIASRAALFVAADTGALHLAALTGTPTVGLFGPKDPRIYGPRGPRTAVVFKGTDCSPCPKRSCANPICMSDIEPEDVLEAALPLLDGMKRRETARADGRPEETHD